MNKRAPSDSRTFVSAFARGLRVMESFSIERPRMSLAEISALTGFDRAVVRRLLFTLVELGYARVDGRVFELTPQVLRLAYAFLSSHGLGWLLGKRLDTLSRKISETVSVSVLAGTEVLIISRSNAAGRHVTSDIGTGNRLPLHASAAGRVLLSSLSEEVIRERLDQAVLTRFTDRTIVDPRLVFASIINCREAGHIVSDQELEQGLLSASVPIKDNSGETIASLNASSHSSRMTASRLETEIVPILKLTSAEITSHMT